MTMLPRVVVSQVKHNSYFVAGLCAGLWLALAAVPLGEEEPCAPLPPAAPMAAADEFPVVREERPPGPAGAGHGGARSVQRPRYYTTELGMRAPLLAGVLSSEDMLESRVAALNQTAGRLQPALRFFMSASAPGTAAPRANVVAFTDTRQMLKPFHALKYLADNYLDDYNFFFLTTDSTFINSRRLVELVSRLSVSQDLYMGTVADDDSHYCSLEGGILLSNSVLRAVQLALDWCVRNSYSPRHHENLGRCVLHAARQPCRPTALGEQYESLELAAGGAAAALRPALADAVTARDVTEPADMYRLHAYVSRVYLERDQQRQRVLRGQLARLRRRAPPHYRNATWPRGLRQDPALQPTRPDTRFDHLRWTAFNATHAFLPHDHGTVAPISRAHQEALQLVWERARAWALRVWGGGASGTAGGGGAAGDRDSVSLLEGAWRWEPPHALRYRLLLAHAQRDGRTVVRQLEVARPLGAARLAPVPYVTESARVAMLLPVTPREVRPAVAMLQRYRAELPANTALYVVMITPADGAGGDWAALRAACAAPVPAVALLQAAEGADGLTEPGRLALAAAARGLARDALTLLLHPRAEFNDDFLNRVRMNTIAGASWYLPAPFSRYQQYLHPRFVDAAGKRQTTHTGHFSVHDSSVVAFYKRDFDNALAAWRGDASASIPDILVAHALRPLSAPEPALVLSPSRAPPCPGASETAHACRRALATRRFAGLPLGAPAELAKLLLDTQPPAQPA